MNTFSDKYNKFDHKKYETIFQNLNCKFSRPKYMFFQARGADFTASFYESGKFVIQGKGAAKIMNDYFGGAFANEPAKTSSTGQIAPYPHIGIDESGKGDFFGPLVIAGVLLDEEGAKKCQQLGVLDSKKLDDRKILSLATSIKSISTFDVIAVTPIKYNELYASFKNLNKLLAWGHSTVLENILKKKPCEIAISDKFADESVIINALKDKGKNIKLIQQTKAESDTAVAAASILARAEFVNRMQKLSESFGIELPKGASQLVLSQGKRFIQKYGENELRHVAKLHFKTYNDICNSQKYKQGELRL